MAFLAALIPYCPCPEMRTTKAAEHECCAPVAGLRAAPSDCCARHCDARTSADSPKTFSPAALTATAVAVGATVAMQAPELPSALRPSFCPSPPLILRV